VTAVSRLQFHNRPPFGFVRVPFFHHRHFFRHPRIVIIGFPDFIGFPGFTGTSFTTTQFVPIEGWTDSRMAGNPPADAGVGLPAQLAPFDPSPQEVVERMLTIAAVKKGDVVYDLGSGDGRVVIAAAKKYGVKAVGFEIDPGLVKLARENVRQQGVEKLVEIRQQDFMTADLSKATVVTLYLSYDGNLALQPKLMHELRPGARVVSYTFGMPGWDPKVMESYRDAAGVTHLLYLWQISDPPLYSENSVEILRPQPTGDGPAVIDVK
jgi:SAM-dependent methyltransferase